jgi:hypothetical protein
MGLTCIELEMDYIRHLTLNPRLTAISHTVLKFSRKGGLWVCWQDSDDQNGLKGWRATVLSSVGMKTRPIWSVDLHLRSLVSRRRHHGRA